MRTNPRPRLCVFCGKDKSHGKMTVEHFVFKGLWAGPRPSRTRTVPAHEVCNAEFCADNEYVRDVLVMAVGAEQHPEVKRLLQGELKRKMERTPAAIAKTLRNLRIMPLVTASGLYVGSAPVFEVDWPRMERVLQNVVKGVYYTATKRPLPQDVVIRVVPVTDRETLEYLRPDIDLMVDWQSFGDDVFACRYVTGRSVPRISCLMQFYRHRLFFGEALSKKLIEDIERQHASINPSIRNIGSYTGS